MLMQAHFSLEQVYVDSLNIFFLQQASKNATQFSILCKLRNDTEECDMILKRNDTEELCRVIPHMRPQNWPR